MIGGAAVDVMCEEPPDMNSRLLQHPKCIVTPHVAFASRESMEKRARIVFDSLNAWMAGRQINKVL